MVKGRVNNLAYSGRSPLDYRNPGKTFLGGESIYTPDKFDTIAAIIGSRGAKQRVEIDSMGRYKYTPSTDYAIARLKLRFRFKK